MKTLDVGGTTGAAVSLGFVLLIRQMAPDLAFGSLSRPLISADLHCPSQAHPGRRGWERVRCGPEFCQMLRKLFCCVTGSYIAQVGIQLSV